MSQTHTYRSRLVWQGSTADGPGGCARSHQVLLPPARDGLTLSWDRQPEHANPEQLLLAAASSCQLLWFLELAVRRGIGVLAYEDDAEAVMPEDQTPVRITQVTLRPRITIAPGTDVAKTAELVERAHERCYIANTLNAAVIVLPVIEQARAAATPAR